jgi:hypothetical protein
MTSRMARRISSRGQQPFAFEQTRLEFESHRSGLATSTHRDLVRLALAAGKRVPADRTDFLEPPDVRVWAGC